ARRATGWPVAGYSDHPAILSRRVDHAPGRRLLSACCRRRACPEQREGATDTVFLPAGVPGIGTPPCMGRIWGSLPGSPWYTGSRTLGASPAPTRSMVASRVGGKERHE